MSWPLVTVDLWDTILRRSVHPNEIKMHTARLLQLQHSRLLRAPWRTLAALYAERCGIEAELGRVAITDGHDDEYHAREVLRTWMGRVSWASAEQVEQISRALEQSELAYERSAISLDGEIVATLQRLDPQRIAIISDFYWGAEEVRAFLKQVDFPLTVEKIFVSCDYRLNKRSGRLFRRAQEELGVTSSQHYHIGDSPTSDIEPAKALGITTSLYRPTRAEHARNVADQRFRAHHDASALEAHLAACCADVSVPETLTATQRALFVTGASHALAFVAPVYSAMEAVTQRSQNRIFYFTREGWFFKRLHTELALHARWPKPFPEARVLEVSRVATFAASLRSLSPSELMRMWRLYSTQSIDALLTSLGIAPAEYDADVARLGLDRRERLTYPWSHASMLQFLDDDQVRSKLSADLHTKKELLTDYLRVAGIDGSTPAVSIFDIGWRGTIQDNLAYLLPRTMFDGYYLGLYPFLNDQPANTAKVGLCCNMNRSLADTRPFEYASVLEMMCNSSTGSVIGYRTRADNGITAIVEHHRGEDSVHDNWIRYFQDGVAAAAARIGQFLALQQVEAVRLRAIGLSQLNELITHPTDELAAAFFRLHHNEGFGVGELHQKRAELDLRLLAKSLFSKAARRKIVEAAEASGWPQGFLVANHLSPLVGRYNLHVLYGKQ